MDVSIPWLRAVLGALPAACLALCSGVVRAHDLITAEAADRYVAQARAWVAVAAAKEPPAARADASVSLARMLDEIRDLLNSDLATHGRVQGLPSHLLIERLKEAGSPLGWAERLGRYGAPVQWYRTGLDLDPRGRRAGEALFGWLSGSFYDGFRDDPLKPLAPDTAGLLPLIEAGERYAREFPRDANLEEGRFITAILRVRAARAGLPERKVHGARARELLRDFQRDYPDSLRSAAVPVLLDALP
ncbi:MAG: hypothetical protein ACK6DF_11995 [Betaproteobacteria bacterium]